MGYTTEFDGHFTLTPAPDAATLRRLQALDCADGGESNEPGMPQAYNQWHVTSDGHGLQWDGNEKFYHYVDWLQWLIDFVFTPASLTLSGEVTYYGEAPADTGTLRIEHGQVVRDKNVLVSLESFKELTAFK